MKQQTKPRPLASWLDLAPVSARVHRRQNAMTIFCIVLAVALVATIFAMADMELRTQRRQAIRTDGNWHVATTELTADEAAVVAARPDVAAVGLYDVVNYGLDSGYTLAGQEVAVCGSDENFYTEIFPMAVTEGRAPAAPGEVMLTESAKTGGVALGDAISLQTPTGSHVLTVVGFIETTTMLSVNDAVGAVLTLEGFEAVSARHELNVYIRFTPLSNKQAAIAEIETAFGLSDGALHENAKLMTLDFSTSNRWLASLYGTALVLFVLVLAAGAFMIAGTLNSSVAARTSFFGLLRCLGATPRQVRRYVRREALQWCAVAVPAGLAIGCAVSWALCALLRFLSPSYFYDMPMFALSPVALVFGALVGLVTVGLAARTPAKRAGRVSPLTALRGNDATGLPAGRLRKPAGGNRLAVQLGVRHALAARRNLILVAGSFALSIVLFLAFDTALAFFHHGWRPVQPYTPDLSVVSTDNTCSLPGSLQSEFAALPGVKRVYGRRFSYSLPAETSDGRSITVNLVSYEQHQYGWAAEDLLEGALGSADAGADYTALAVFDPYAADALAVGDSVTLPSCGEAALTVSGLLSQSPLDREEGVLLLICNEATFEALTGETGYTIFDIQVTNRFTDDDLAAVRSAAAAATGGEYTFSDRRAQNLEGRGAYLAIAVFFYGFEVVIALITVLGILNCIQMSVSARLGQYGVMRAVGLTLRQLRRMVLAEAAANAAAGCLVGVALGLPLHWALYTSMITGHWGTAWQVPWGALAVILVLVAGSALLAACAPAGRLRRLSITETIGGE